MSFLATNARSIEPTSAGTAPPAPAHGYTPVERLPHWDEAEPQALTNWCWAAVARAIRRYYRLSADDNALPASQCCYVARQYGIPYQFACKNPNRATGQDCNLCWKDCLVDPALNLTGRLPELLWTDGHLDETDFEKGIEIVDGKNTFESYLVKIRQQLRMKRPVALHFEKLKTISANHTVLEGHFVVAFGFNRVAGTIDIWDPNPDREEPILLSYLYQFGALAHLIYTKP